MSYHGYGGGGHMNMGYPDHGGAAPELLSTVMASMTIATVEDTP
jgi:hypothetical protein